MQNMVKRSLVGVSIVPENEGEGERERERCNV